jgi:uncharacterized protein YndB with AHSA1/START domain
MTNHTELGELTIVRIQAAPIDLVFDCMTTPEHLTHFWGPTGTTTPLDGIVIDLRPGGTFSTRMVGEDGSEFTMTAVYVEVDRPTRLVWTEPGVEGGMTTSTTFRAIDEHTTEVTIHQTNVPAMFLTAEAQAGFLTSLDRSDAYLAQIQT